jgi:AraC-like DNA-binding protein
MSAAHAHHGMHIVVALRGELRVRAGKASWQRAAGVLTAPDALHAIDGTDAEVLLVFLDPESDAGSALQATLDGLLHLIGRAAADALAADADPLAIMREGGVAWTARAVDILGGRISGRQPNVHPRVRRVLAQLRTLPVGGDVSLEALARAAHLSPGRLMHAFTESIGVPLRPYIAWLKLQRAAAALAGGAALSDAAAAAGFADAAHMSRTFRRMFGVSPSTLRAQIVAS